MKKKQILVIVSSVLIFCLLSFAPSVLAKNVTYNQSRMLDSQVEDGDLPSVEERLPENPRVIEVADQIGNYGGELDIIDLEEAKTVLVEHSLETLPNPGFEETEMEANILSDWEVSEDGKTFTFKIRKGLKWSDGNPVTTEDVRFTLEDLYNISEIFPAYPEWLKRGGEKVELEIINDHEFKLKFAKKYGIFPLRLQSINNGSYHQLISPSHYLKEFHKSYKSDEELETYLEEENLKKEEWGELVRRKYQSSPWNVDKDVGYPTLAAYVVKEKPSNNVTILERNPYYHKVDKEGNQLPYIDSVRVETLTDQEIVNMKIISGEIDFTKKTGLSDISLYKENEEQGDYRTILASSKSIDSKAMYFPNLTLDEEVWQETVTKKDFRKALSLAINREEINNLVFYGRGKASQATDAPGSPFVEPEFREAYAEYDPERANEILDNMGFDERNKDGFRLTPDGDVISVDIEFFEVNSDLVPTTELVADYWREIGIKASMQVIDQGLWYQRQGANETRMSVWHTDGVRPGVPFFWFVPYTTPNWAPEWQEWHVSGGESGEEPPKEVKKLFDHYETIIRTTDKQERIKAGKAILKSQAENLWVIGTVNSIPRPVVINNKLKNVEGAFSAQFGPSMAEQYYFEE